MRKKYKVTIIGAIITILSFFATWTFIVPIISIVPAGASLELLFGLLFSGSSYSSISFYILIILFVLLVIIIRWFLKKLIKEKVENKKRYSDRLAVFFILLFFIVHPLGFYIWAMINSDNAGDGQFIFGILETFPISSFAFVIIGFSVDLVINKQVDSNE